MNELYNIEQVLLALSEPYTEKTTYYRVHCPYHHDPDPDMLIYKNTGICVCVVCGEKVPLRKFIKDKNSELLNHLSFENRLIKRNKYPERIVIQYPKGYIQAKHDFSYLGLTDEMLRHFNIGYCSNGIHGVVDDFKCKGCYFYDRGETKQRWISTKGYCWFAYKRIMIPVEKDGVLYDIESRSVDLKSKSKKVLFPHFSKGYLTIFNYNELDRDEPLYVMEGRKGCLRFWRDVDKNCTAIFSNRIKEGQKRLLEEFKHIILIPDLGRAGEMMIGDFNKLNIGKLEIINLPKCLLCKQCKHKFRGLEKQDICPDCGSDNISYMDVFDFETDTLKYLINNSTTSIEVLLDKLGIKETVKLKKERS